MNSTNPQQSFSGVSGGGELSLYQYFLASPLFAGFKDFESPERKIFMSEYYSMPSSLKNFLASTETATNLSSMGLNYQLDDAQISKIAGTLREIVVGKIFIKDLPMTISSRLGIDDIKAGEIVNKIVAQSFGPIIEDIKRIQRNKFPDKVMAMQKEAQPSGLTRPGVGEARPRVSAQPPASQEIKDTPLSQTGSNQNVQSVRPPMTQPQPIRPPSPQGVAQIPQTPPQQTIKPPTPPQQPNSIDFSQVKQAQGGLSTNPSSVPPKSFDSIQSKPATAPQAPVQQSVQKPQFKMPDINLEPEKSTPDIKNTPPGAQKSLEEELEKVASVIDLRAKQGE